MPGPRRLVLCRYHRGKARDIIAASSDGQDALHSRVVCERSQHCHRIGRTVASGAIDL